MALEGNSDGDGEKYCGAFDCGFFSELNGDEYSVE